MRPLQHGQIEIEEHRSPINTKVSRFRIFPLDDIKGAELIGEGMKVKLVNPDHEVLETWCR